MYSFFVLGLIPGTNLQITFQSCLDLLEVLVAVYGLIWLLRRHHQPGFTLLPRAPLHASQLHTRLTI